MRNVRFEDLARAIEGVGWVETNVTGLHHRYEDPEDLDRFTIIVKPHGGR